MLLAIPTVRAIVEAVVMKVAVDIGHDFFFKSDADPVFKAKYLELSAELRSSKTIEEKRSALNKLRDLRRS